MSAKMARADFHRELTDHKPLVYRVLAGLFLISFLGISIAGSSVIAERPSNLRWQNEVIRIAFSSSFNNSPSILRGTNVRRSLERSLFAWQDIADIRFELVDSDDVNVSPDGRTGNGINLITIAGTAQNTNFFSGDLYDSPAATKLFFDAKGNIIEADIVLNTAELFSANGQYGTYDLDAVFMHEIGHLLGLVHTDVSSSVMHTSISKNHSPVFVRDRLSLSDIAAARALYGAPDQYCCGKVEGRSTLENGKGAPDQLVWVEDGDDGRFVTAVRTDRAGRFSIEGLESGQYRVGSINAEGSITYSIIDIEPDSVVSLERDTIAQSSIPLVIFGTDGQLSLRPVETVPGQVSRVYFGLPSGSSKSFSVEALSDRIRIDPASFTRHFDFSGYDVISIQVSVAENTLPGTYSFVLRSIDSGSVILPSIFRVSERRSPR